MTYARGIVAPTMTPAAALMTVINTALLAAGFTLEGTLTSGVATANVYKSAIAVNGVLDWYLTVRRSTNTSATSAVSLVCHEGFDGTNATGVCPTGTNTPATTTYLCTLVGAPALGTNMYSQAQLTCNRAGTEYLYSITPQRVIIYTSDHTASPDEFVYVGLFDNLVPGWALPNLCSANMFNAGTTGSSAYVGMTREPFQTLSSADNFYGWMHYTNSTTNILNATSVASSVYTGRPSVAPLAIISARGNAVRGNFKDVITTGLQGSYNTGWLAGDTAIVYDMFGVASTYVYITQTSASVFLIKQV